MVCVWRIFERPGNSDNLFLPCNRDEWKALWLPVCESTRFQGRINFWSIFPGRSKIHQTQTITLWRWKKPGEPLAVNEKSGCIFRRAEEFEKVVLFRTSAISDIDHHINNEDKKTKHCERLLMFVETQKNGCLSVTIDIILCVKVIFIV